MKKLAGDKVVYPELSYKIGSTRLDVKKPPLCNREQVIV